MSKYHWKLSGFAKGIDPVAAVKELERIEEVYGSLTAETILHASTPKNALFHPLFIWNDSEAANQYRLSQARTIINNVQVVILTDNEPRMVSAYEVVRKENINVYKHVIDFTPEDIRQVKQRTIREINALKNKLSFYKDFELVIARLDEVINDIDNT